MNIMVMTNVELQYNGNVCLNMIQETVMNDGILRIDENTTPKRIPV